MKTRDPITRYWFISQLAQRGMLAAIDQGGYITRPLRPHAQRPGQLLQHVEPRPHSDIVREREALRYGDQGDREWALREAFRRGSNTHEY